MAGYKFSFNPVEVPHVLTKNRIIKTPIPSPGSKNIIDRLELCESQSMQGQLPVIWARAENYHIYDIAGNKWIDFTSTIFVANVGHSNAMVLKAIKSAINKPLISSYAYINEIRVKYLEKLINFIGRPFEKAFLLSAGTEATEAALKLMRMHGQKVLKKRNCIICIEGNWHGRTMGAQMMGSNIAQKEWIGYQDQDIIHIPFPYPWALEANSGVDFLRKSLDILASKGIDIENDVAGFMLETFQGWGAIFYPKDYVKAIESLCRKNNILMAFDEMQAGFGRTGYKFGFQFYEVTPDLICCGKGMGGGVPLSGVIGRKEVMDLPEIGNMSSTHSANPLVCAAGLAVLEEIERLDLVSESSRKGKILFKKLNEIKNYFSDNVSCVLGVGMVAALIFKSSKNGGPDSLFASLVAERCMQKGLLVVHTGRESIKIGPPLTIRDDALIEGLEVLFESISEIKQYFDK